MSSAWVNDENSALFTDLYQLTMLQAYFEEGLDGTAVFDLFARRLPAQRNFLIAAGLDDFLSYLETFRFATDALKYLKSLDLFSESFLDYLAEFRFAGDVYALKEGTPVFANEPIIEVAAPLPQGQLAETFALNQIHFQTVAASKAVRVVEAAQGNTVVDFGARRMHGSDAAMKAARAFFIAGVDATSNVLAAKAYGIPPSGTMAHSYVEAHADEMEAFEAFNRTFPATVLLVDTYDTLQGVRKVVALAHRLGDAFQARAIRLDSGDLGELARQSRRILDQGGLDGVEIFASGSLDEQAIRDLLRRGAPIDGFGVGTRMGVSQDAPSFDSAYKLVEYSGSGRMKLSKNKSTLPGRKQVFRRIESGEATGDVIAQQDEELPGRPLLEIVMRKGRRLPAGELSLKDCREHCRRELELLPSRLRHLDPAEPAYPVEISAALAAQRDELRQQLSQRHARSK